MSYYVNRANFFTEESGHQITLDINEKITLTDTNKPKSNFKQWLGTGYRYHF